MELSVKTMNRLVGKASKEKFHILLAHTPKYGDALLGMGWRFDSFRTLSWRHDAVAILGGVISQTWAFLTIVVGILKKRNTI